MPLSLRFISAYSVVSLFILYFLVSGVRYQVTDAPFNVLSSPKAPDFSQYRDLDILTPEQFPLDDEKRRVIVLGDVHGMHDEFRSLLSKLSYDQSKDVLVSSGDIIAKGTLNGSLAVLTFMATHNVTAVRGNHDQKVIEWRSWIKWISSLPSGRRWLRHLYSHFLESLNAVPPGEKIDVDDWVDKERKKDRKRNNNTKWWDRIPDGWKLFSDHYLIAERMSEHEYQYLLQRPTKIHVPHAHAYIAHAGVLASNPELEPWDKRQPLSHLPSTSSKDKEHVLRKLQELAVLSDVPQNQNPWVTLNMRSILKDKTVTRSGKEGTPWTEVYNDDMSLCKGYQLSTRFDRTKDRLPCHPATVIYGHAASRGLDIKRWTIGLDSGCVYDRRLSALVLGGKYARSTFTEESADADDDPEHGAYDIQGKKLKSTIRFGDSGKGKIFSVKCH